MKNVLESALVVIVSLTTPTAFAGLTPVYDYAPSDPCGSIDPDKACWIEIGTSTCPSNTSYAKCMERCNCQYNKNLERCSKDNSGSPALACRQKAQLEKEACEGGCLSDHPPLRTSSVA